MTSEVQDVDVAALRALYNRSPLHKAFFDWLANAERKRAKTNVDRILTMLQTVDVDVNRHEVTTLLRDLETTGCGVFVAGRRGRPSRFLWSFNLINVGRTASGLEEVLEPLPDLPVAARQIGRRPDQRRTAAPRKDDAITHSFNLRPDFKTEFILPVDLTSEEVERLASFLRTLPFPT